MKTTQEKIKWCIEQHKNTNHLYDDYLPYEFHLRLVVAIANQFMDLIQVDWEDDAQNISETIILSAWGHDLIEDTRVTYNDVKSVLGTQVADIIYALTNEKGKNRKERANDKYYRGIRETQGAVFVKLCDRIANVRYSKMTKSRMFEMYKKENEKFMTNLGYDGNKNHPYFEMFIFLTNQFHN